ncbi:putative addiction module component [Azoarcus sp. Aa7]|nr:putative addiction module component [Azoarcus sp. Aa7]
MSATLESVMAEAMKLTPDERADLIETLIASAEPATRLHPAWEAEIGRRLDDLEAGRTEAVPADEVFARIEAELKRAGA